jgi:uncharacterized protein (DUF2147 family)
MIGVSVAGSLCQTSAALEGTWLTEDGSSKIRFESCGAFSCGRLVWLRDPNDPETGQPLLDKNNPDPALRGRRLLGILVFTELQAVHSGAWKAKAYNAEDSKQYDVTLTITPPDQLSLKGCGLAGLICRTELWTRSH